MSSQISVPFKVMFTDSPQKSGGMCVYLNYAFFGTVLRIYKKVYLGTAILGNKQSEGMNMHVDVASRSYMTLGK